MTGCNGYSISPVRFGKNREGIDILRQTRLTQDRSGAEALLLLLAAGCHTKDVYRCAKP
jgi:hypothetical protein